MTVPPTNRSIERSQAAALQMTLEWLEHPEFRERVSGQVFMESVTLGRTYLEIAKQTNYNDYNPVFTQAKERWYAALTQAEKLGWLAVDRKSIGRPRTRDYSPTEIANAFRRLSRLGRSKELEQRDECITGGAAKTNVSVVTLQDNLWFALLKDVTAEAISGNSREEIAEALGLPPRAASCFWRWLTRNGWKQKRLRLPDGSRPYVLVQEAAK